MRLPRIRRVTMRMPRIRGVLATKLSPRLPRRRPERPSSLVSLILGCPSSCGFTRGSGLLSTLERPATISRSPNTVTLGGFNRGRLQCFRCAVVITCRWSRFIHVVLRHVAKSELHAAHFGYRCNHRNLN